MRQRRERLSRGEMRCFSRARMRDVRQSVAGTGRWRRRTAAIRSEGISHTAPSDRSNYEGDTQMSWETRRGRGRYYTRSYRVGGKIVREYVGCGLVGEVLAEGDEILRAERALIRQHQQALRRRELTVEDTVAEACRRADRLMASALEAAGYHRHARGEWRKKRVNRKTVR